jgi:hypothetical protein
MVNGHKYLKRLYKLKCKYYHCINQEQLILSNKYKKYNLSIYQYCH